MSPLRRDLILKVVDGQQQILPIVYHVDRLTRCDEVLMYLVKNKITGKAFLNFFQERGNSILQTFADILKRINKEKECKPILAGKDYIT